MSQKAAARDEAEIVKMKHELQALLKQPLMPIGTCIYDRTILVPKYFFRTLLRYEKLFDASVYSVVIISFYGNTWTITVSR